MPMPPQKSRGQAPGLRALLLEKDRERRSKQAALARAVSGEPALRNDLLPRLHLVDRSPESLVAPARNIRSLEASHIREVANSIAALGFTVPILIDGSGDVIDGVVRLEAAKLLGLPTVPCIVAEHLTPTQRRLMRLAADRLAEKGSWNLAELKIELEELMVIEAPVEISGFELTEIDAITADDAAGLEVGPLVPDTGRAVSRLGDTFILGLHRLHCGDAVNPDVLRAFMAGDMARAVITDQPYNVPIAGHVTGGRHREFAMASGEMTEVEFRRFNDEWMGAALPHLMDGGLLATYIDWRGLASVTAAACAAELSQINLVVWAKSNAGMGSLYRSQHELFPLFKKGNAPHINNVDLSRKGRHRSNLWSYPGASTMGSDARRGLQHHPTVKPTAMLVEALKDLTNRGDIVLDPFLGSGSTLIAAEMSGRICRGVELDPLYVDVIVRRYEKAARHSATLEATKETFAELEARRAAEAE